MLDYLIEREQEEMFRISSRDLTFPDGEVRRVAAYRLIWRWFDRAIGYEFAPDEDEILELALKCANEETLPVGHALGRVLDHVVACGEEAGLDYTDDNLQLLLAKRAIETFHARKKD